MWTKTRLLFETASLAARMVQHDLVWQDSFAARVATRLDINAPRRP